MDADESGADSETDAASVDDQDEPELSDLDPNAEEQARRVERQLRRIQREIRG
jgi:hypothetical protein